MKMYGNAQDAVDKLIAAFNNPKTLTEKVSRMYVNQHGTPCEAWSFMNRFLVSLSDTSDARGFNQWKEVNRMVKKGSKAIYILAPLFTKTTDKITGEESSFLYGFKSVPVFRYEDTEGEPLVKSEDTTWVNELPFIEVAKAWGIQVQVKGFAGAAEASYNTVSNKITMRVENPETFIHELVHAADMKQGTLQNRTRSQREIVAEFGAAILANMIGLKTEANSYDYLKSWADGGDVQKSVMSLLKDTCNLVDTIVKTAQAITA